MKRILHYIAYDGTMFESPIKCMEYESAHNFYAQYTCLKFYDVDWNNISEYLASDIFKFTCDIYAFKAENNLDIDKIKELFKSLDLTTRGIEEPGEYHISLYDNEWEKG